MGTYSANDLCQSWLAKCSQDGGSSGGGGGVEGGYEPPSGGECEPTPPSGGGGGNTIIINNNFFVSIVNIFTCLCSGIVNLCLVLHKITSPLALDLDGDGVETVPLASGGVTFDFNRDGVGERAAWVGKDDGLLVYDRNGNGVIDDGGELFGDNTPKPNGDSNYANGFEALKEFDSNGDGQISAADQAFAQLKVWRDNNGDAITDAGELISLADVGVASISLQYQESTMVDSSGNPHKQLGSYTTTAGGQAKIDDVYFVMAEGVAKSAAALADSMASMGAAPVATASYVPQSVNQQLMAVAATM